LQDERIRQQLSQAALAEEIGTTGLNVSRWERGLSKPHPYFRDRLCRFFGKAAWELDLELAPDALGALPTIVPIYDPCIPAHPPRPFVGRANELAAMKTRLCASANGMVVSMQGLPGVGKTTLAWALTHSPHIRRNFQEGVLWATLGPDPDLPQLLSRWAAVLGIQETSMATIRTLPEWIGTLRNAIGMRRMLLVIDDVWSPAYVGVFRVGGPNCVHLLTTRFRSVAAIVATPPGAPILIRELGFDESLVLLQRLAPETGGCAASELKTFVRSVGGLPLALRQAGSYLHRTATTAGTDAVPAALQHLCEPGMLLQLNELPEAGGWYPGTAPVLPPTLEAVIASICQELSGSARAALAALALFPPKPHVFSESEALSAAHCSLEALDELLDAGVLEPRMQDSYALHAVIAAYARTFLAQER